MATPEKVKNEEGTIPFFPDHISTEAWVSFGILILIIGVGILGQLFPVGLDAPADPLNTPAHVKPEWYFLFLYQILKFVPKTIGALLPIVGVLVILIWPFLDKKVDTKRARMIRIIVSIVAMVAIIALTIWGEVS